MLLHEFDIPPILHSISSCYCIAYVGDGLDEPTSGLDSHSSLELMNIMKRLTSKVGRYGKTDCYKFCGSAVSAARC